MKDIKTAVGLLVNCMLGNQTLMIYNICRQVQTLYFSFDDHMPKKLKRKDPQEFEHIFKKLNYQDKINIFNKINNEWCYCYNSTI